MLCLAAGTVLGVVFSSVAVVIHLASGAAPFHGIGVSLGSSIAGYLVGFAAAGLVAGTLNPLAQTKGGAMLVGVLATLPVAVVALFLLEGTLIPREGGHVFILVVYPVGFGTPAGYLAWREFVASGKR